MANVPNASEESAFRAGLKDAGYVSSDFMIKYERAPQPRSGSVDTATPPMVRVLRMSKAITLTFAGGDGNLWSAPALEQLKAGAFGEK